MLTKRKIQGLLHLCACPWHMQQLHEALETQTLSPGKGLMQRPGRSTPCRERRMTTPTLPREALLHIYAAHNCGLGWFQIGHVAEACPSTHENWHMLHR